MHPINALVYLHEVLSDLFTPGYLNTIAMDRFSALYIG